MTREPAALLAGAFAVFICLKANGIDPLDIVGALAP
jgi:hypothetical protein